MAKSTKQWVCQPGSYGVLHTHQQLELNRWQLLALLTLLKVCIPDWIVPCGGQIWIAICRYLQLWFKCVQMLITSLSQARIWELINPRMIPYNSAIRSLPLLQPHNYSERTLRTLITKEPDADSLAGNTSGSFYIFAFQAVAYIFKLYGIRSLLQLFSDSPYLYLIPNRIQSVIAWAKRQAPIFVDPITHICWVSICDTEQPVLCHRSVSNNIDSNSIGLGHIKMKNSRR